MSSVKPTSLSVAAALAGAIGMAGAVVPTTTVAQDQTKCYGVAKAGENMCANEITGEHSCQGQSTVDYHGGDWVLMPASACEEEGGRLEPWDGINQAMLES